ncbi:MlaD family protein [Nocardia stercoris]|uniref:MCE family protein n=1 Tax=Nocardia stercoris TaxID=2483361 RepID=A0A3M2L009_9NOCA|nr:MlaD family protein [Nocardia stercoris]RMI30040.1 MCE family protein [Nocardia stercoris]
MNLRGAVSLSAIATVLVVGIGYMSVGVLHLDPRRSYLTADMRLDNSGGLAVNSPVLLVGVQVGRIESVSKQASGALVRLRIDDRYHIPLSSAVRVEQLSALGEPYVEFAPESADGPYLRDGQTISTNRIRMPMTITALSAKVVELLEQVHPETVAALVSTFDHALSGTDAAVQTLQRSTSLLAATLLSRTPELRRLFADLQAMGANMDWLGPALTTAGPPFGYFGATLSQIVEGGATLVESRPVEGYFTGDGLVPFLTKLTDLVRQLGPDAVPVTPAIAPAIADAEHSAPALDIGTLLKQALQTVDPDGTVHVHIALK